MRFERAISLDGLNVSVDGLDILVFINSLVEVTSLSQSVVLDFVRVCVFCSAFYS